MLARDLRNLPEAEQQLAWTSPMWVIERKWDGVRFQLHVGPSENRLVTRIGTERTDHFPHLRDLPLAFLDGTILDGELVLDKESAFTGTTWAKGSLACTMAVTNCSPGHAIEMQTRVGKATLHVFDLLKDRDQLVTGEPFWRRRARLESIFQEFKERGVSQVYLWLMAQVHHAKYAYHLQTLAEGGEGSVLKKMDGIYTPGSRSPNVLKVKRALTVDGFITGFTVGRHGNTGLIGCLLVSAYDEDGNVREIAGVEPYDLSLGPRSNLRQVVTVQTSSGPTLSPEFLGRVVEIGGFRWNKNFRVEHAKLIRFRDHEKTARSCVITFKSLKVS